MNKQTASAADMETGQGGAAATAFPVDYPGALRFMLSHAGPRLLLAALLMALFLRFLVGGLQWADVIVLALFISLRGFMEWGLHMYVFNAAPLPLLGIRLRNPISVMHGIHHQNPRQVEALFFGWKGVLLVLSLSFCMLLLFFRDSGLALSSVVAMVVNLLLYEWFHLLAHSSITPETSWMRAAVNNHRHHHFVDGSQSMGVSSTLADRLLGTYRGE